MKTIKCFCNNGANIHSTREDSFDVDDDTPKEKIDEMVKEWARVLVGTRIMLQRLNRIAERNTNEAYEAYKNRNALASIGDIVRDNRHPIIVENVELMIHGNNITICYSGNYVTKDFKPQKRYNKGYATQDSSFKILRRGKDA